MSFTPRRLWHRVKIENQWVTTKGDLQISESIDQLSRVCEFDLAEQPVIEPDYDHEVLVEFFDFDDETFVPVFGGTVNVLTPDSFPWNLTVTCTDQLRLLDRVRQSTDLNLTGMTPKEALMEVLDYVSCTYDPDDLADPVYTLGEQEPVKWLVDVPASQIVNELSTVFGCVLMTVGNNRIVWLSHDSTPSDGTGSYGTYTRGTSINFLGHGRIHGDSSQVQNNWIVRGVEAQISKQCTATPWAKAKGTNPQLGRKRRTAEQSFTSDLIQSEDLAEAIVRRLMRETNRLPDERTIPMTINHDIHPTSKITIVDPTYGLGGTTYATVLAVDRSGYQQTLRLAAGPGGSEGTVTTGVDKVCSDTHTDVDWPGDDFEFPDFDYPDIPIPDPIDFDTDFDFPLLFTPAGIDGGNTEYNLTGLLNVVAVPPGGTYDDSVIVVLLPTYPCTIYYTDDGSTPTTSSTVYTVPLTISSSTVLKFFGQADASHISPIRTETYTITLGGAEGFLECNELLVAPFDGDWVVDFDVFGPPEAGSVTFDGVTGLFDVDPTSGPYTGWGVAAEIRTGVPTTESKWRLTVRSQSLSGTDLYAMVQVIDNDGGVSYIQKILGLISGTTSDNEDNIYQEDTVDDHDFFFGGAHHMSTGFRIVLERDGGTMIGELQNSSGSVLESESWAHDWDAGASAEDLMIQLVVFSSTAPAGPGAGGFVEFDSVQLCHGSLLDSIVPVPEDWTTEFGTILYPGEGELSFLNTLDAQAVYDDSDGSTFPFDVATPFVWSGHVDLTGTDEVLIAFHLMDSGSTTFASVELSVTATREVNFYDFDSGGSVASYVFPDTFNFMIFWNPDDGLLEFEIDGDPVDSVPLGTWPVGTDLFPKISHGEADSISALFTDMLFLIGA